MLVFFIIIIICDAPTTSVTDLVGSFSLNVSQQHLIKYSRMLTRRGSRNVYSAFVEHLLPARLHYTLCLPGGSRETFSLFPIWYEGAMLLLQVTLWFFQNENGKTEST